jgi:polyisoprenoid-binding protein YceI
MTRLLRNVVVGALALAVPTIAVASDYNIDVTHSQVMFRVKHLGISKVTGAFTTFEGSFQFDPADLSQTKVMLTLDPASVDTGNEKRDAHLQSEDFFDVVKFPEMTFVSTKVTDVTDDSFTLHGDLTMHGVTKPVVLEVEFGGAVKDPWGNQRAAFSAKGTIQREEFGLSYNAALETGGFVIGKDVDIIIEVEGIAA